jgi:predicted lipoprotein with Yx(FWY)xxD motif
MVTLKTAKFRVAGLLALAISAIAVAGCGSASSSTSSTAAAAQPAPAASSATTSTSSSDESGPEEVGTAKGSAGTYLTADEGRAVYLWVADTGNKSSCSGACAKAWPPVETKGQPKAEDGVNASDLGTTTRSDGTEQVTYKGHPLYYFVADKSKGATKGQGSNSFGAVWWLVAPSGSAITSGGSSSGGAYSSSTSSSSGGGGGWG